MSTDKAATCFFGTVLAALCVLLTLIVLTADADQAQPPDQSEKPGSEQPAEVSVESVDFDPLKGASTVVLRSRTDNRTLTVVVGESEGLAIRSKLLGRQPARPMTHDLLKTIIGKLGATVVKVTVTGLRAGTYYAEIVLRCGEKTLTIDARPSDSIALAVRVGCPIYVAPGLLEEPEGAPPRRPQPRAPSSRDLKDAI